MKIPKHQLIKNNLKNEILSGKFESGDKFYSEAELIKRFKVSSITVIRALKELVAEGLLVRYQGKGTFISRSRKLKTVKFSDLEIFSPADDRVEVLSITRDNHPTILTRLELRPTDFYYAIERIRHAKQTPYIYHCTYLPERFVTHPDDYTYYKSIYTQLKNEFKLYLNTEPFVEYNQIVLPTPKKIATLLEISEETPTVKQERTTTLALSGQIVEYICSYKRWEYYKIRLESPIQ